LPTRSRKPRDKGKVDGAVLIVERQDHTAALSYATPQIGKVATVRDRRRIRTMHSLRPSYSEELKLPTNHFEGKRVLEIGCGPLVPILQFSGCERHAIDPLANRYMECGWPLYEYEASILNVNGEKLPYPDKYFDAAISVNALDHVDDFEKVASEMQRVAKSVYFEVEYHEPTVMEPITLSHDRVKRAFDRSNLTMVIDRSGKEMFEALVERFDLLPNQFARFPTERFVTWHGVTRQ
jgi:SAM-dependent methyltransferase